MSDVPFLRCTECAAAPASLETRLCPSCEHRLAPWCRICRRTVMSSRGGTCGGCNPPWEVGIGAIVLYTPRAEQFFCVDPVEQIPSKTFAAIVMEARGDMCTLYVLDPQHVHAKYDVPKAPDNEPTPGHWHFDRP